MPDSLKFKQNAVTGNVEEDTNSSKTPIDINFYWQMTPPVKIGLSQQGGYGEGMQEAGGFGPAPRLTPAGTREESQVDKNTPRPSKIINVRDLHHWTESPISARREVPVLNLKEQRILMNPMLNQLANNVFAMVENAGDALNTLEAIGNHISSTGFDFTAAANELNGGDTKDGVAEKKQQKKAEDKKKGIGIMSTLNGGLARSEVSKYSDPMNPYSLLYTTKPTGFKYSLPYLEDTYVQNSGNFGDAAPSGGNLVQGLNDTAQGITKVLQTANLRKMFAPGRMIEEPKAFSFTGREKSYTVSFPLFNTKTYAEIVKNWSFIYLLSYQNTPNRISRDLIDPPCIYEAYIPGVWYSKYSALTNMTVDFLGARREMYVPVAFLDHADNEPQATASGNWIQKTRKALTVVPDAYQVTLTFTELFAETQNLKHQMLRESMNDKVRTGVFYDE